MTTDTPSVETMMTQTPGSACLVCGHFACVCEIRRKHDEACRYRRAAAGSVAIECEHGYDVCPICDPCTCEKLAAHRAKKGTP